MIIKAVESLGEKQGIKTLKIVGKNKQPILPVDWVAGVDYDFEELDDDRDSDEDFVPAEENDNEEEGNEELDV